MVKLTGDGALVEFASAVEALAAAIEFQQAMARAIEVNVEGNSGSAYSLMTRLVVSGSDL